MKLHQMLSHILKTELKLCQRECKPEFEVVNLSDGVQEVRVALAACTVTGQSSQQGKSNVDWREI